MNPEQPKKQVINPLAGSLKQRILVIGIGLVVLLVLFNVGKSLLAGGNGSAADLFTVLQEQTEVIRVATAGSTTASTEPAQALAYAVELSVMSSNSQLTTYMKQQNLKYNPKLLTLKQSSTVDTELSNAQTNNTYDSTFVSVIQQDLTDYGNALKLAYAADPGPRGRTYLANYYNGVQLLQAQATQAAATVSASSD